MNIEGLDYNTQREQLVLPEYGREIQKMVDYAVALPTKEERQACAESIITTMIRMFPQGYDSIDFEQKLWDHLAIMSNFQLDIDYPFDVSNATRIATKPEPMSYSHTYPFDTMESCCLKHLKNSKRWNPEKKETLW